MTKQFEYDVMIDNNASERAVRPAKTKQKVAGLFADILRRYGR